MVAEKEDLEDESFSMETPVLRTDRLVWVGAPGGDAHLKDPLPVSLGAPTCVFRPVAIEALGKARRDWRAGDGCSRAGFVRGHAM